MSTSSISEGSGKAALSTAARTTVAPNSEADTEARVDRKRPIGVRTALKMTALLDPFAFNRQHLLRLKDESSQYLIKRIGATHVVPEIGPINQGFKRGLAPNELRKGKPGLQDLGLYGVESCRGQLHLVPDSSQLVDLQGVFWQ